jgi:MoaA/NifB/PqqE/SkfB family radical SAM enzyme
MFNFSQLKQLHLEISNNCQAACPMCTRNIHGGIDNPNIKLRDWTLDEYKTMISKEVLNQVEMIYFCGNYGDPLLNNELINMIEYSVYVNPNIEIRLHTNGSLRSAAWWTRLAKTMPAKHSVIFAIDGLEDTHSIYRIGTHFNKIIDNAKVFIAAGGSASWAYIRFKHNEHQVDDAKRLATDIGFKEFSLKDSSRWLLEPKFPVLDKHEQIIYFLEPSKHSDIKIINTDIIKNYQSILEKTEVDCYAKHAQEAYIDAHGNVFPCCWIAMIPYHPTDRDNSMLNIRGKILEQYNDLVSSFGGIEKLSGLHRSLHEIIDSIEYQNLWNIYWTDKKLITCARSCGKMKELFSSPRDQFIETENL